MAKLSANGNELLRIEQELPASELTSWGRVTRTYHSNGKILQKHDCRFKPSQYDPNPSVYSYGWKLYGKIKKELNVTDIVAKKVALIAAGESKWTIVTGGPKVVVIHQSRIIRAIESGEYIGFCKDCGHSQDGCEPDARNYKCEACGAMAVYGAEEMLIGA